MGDELLEEATPPCPNCGEDRIVPDETVYRDVDRDLSREDEGVNVGEYVEDVSAVCTACGCGVGLDVRTRVEAKQVSPASEEYQEAGA